MLKWLKQHIGEFLLVGVLFVGMLYAVTTSWQNQQSLSHNDAAMEAFAQDVKGIKRSLISVLLDKNPDKPAIVRDLVTDASTLKGVDHFNAGEFNAAYAIWTDAAQTGNSDSAFAIAVANKSLAQQLRNPSLAPAVKQSMETTLRSAPEVGERQGFFFLKGKQ